MGNKSRFYLAFKYWKKTNFSKFKGKSIEETFQEIYRKNFWQGSDSISGTGSDELQTETIVRELPKLLEKYKVSSIHDIPCGDFGWISKVDLKSINYLGSDIVPKLIEANKRNFVSGSISFQISDLTADSLPKVDLILTRDCLVHFSYDDTRKALSNIISSSSKYLLTTSFVARERNYNIATGEWRPINLEKPPYNFPSPLLTINENCTQDDGAYPDKSLLLWNIRDLSNSDFV